jgi:hypothetical protein
MSSTIRGPHLPALLRLASQAMTEQLTDWIAASGFTGVQPAHSAVIQPLWQFPEGARITSLARASRITKQSAQRWSCCEPKCSWQRRSSGLL